jgi:hypothetical protein
MYEQKMRVRRFGWTLGRRLARKLSRLPGRKLSSHVSNGFCGQTVKPMRVEGLLIAVGSVRHVSGFGRKSGRHVRNTSGSRMSGAGGSR